MKHYKVYAKPIQNNIANDRVYIQNIQANNKAHACFVVANMIDNKGIYHLDSFFAIPEKHNKKYQLQFCQLKVGSFFGYNGNRYKKKSKRTAYLIDYNRLFYFGKSDIVTTINKLDIIQDGIW